MAAALVLGGCAAGASPEAAAEFAPEYQAIEVQRMDDELVNIFVTMRGARDNADLTAYAECAVAQYTVDRGYGFARHVRTKVSEEGGIWRGDAVYTISSALPDGLRTIDAKVMVQSCAEQGIPTV